MLGFAKAPVTSVTSVTSFSIRAMKSKESITAPFGWYTRGENRGAGTHEFDPPNIGVDDGRCSPKKESINGFMNGLFLMIILLDWRVAKKNVPVSFPIENDSWSVGIPEVSGLVADKASQRFFGPGIIYPICDAKNQSKRVCFVTTYLRFIYSICIYVYIYYYIYICRYIYIWRFPKIGVPNHPFSMGIFHS